MFFGIRDPRSGIRDGKNPDPGSGIRDKHPGSATLVKRSEIGKNVGFTGLRLSPNQQAKARRK